MNSRKLLFVLFSDDGCRQNHALRYALDLQEKGYAVRLILEGPATRMVSELERETGESVTGKLLRRACTAGIVAGACGRASSGCAGDDPARKVADAARAGGVTLLSDLDGHAGIEPFVREGYEVVVI